MTLRIAVGSLFIECNHFGGAPADQATFRRSEWLTGDDLLALDAGTVGGMLRVLREERVELIPLLVASACPSGPITDDCYAELKHEMLTRLRAAGPVDGVLLALHGSATSESIGDVEGDLLAAVRAQVGERVALVGSLDHHAHVTCDMVTASDGLVAWDTYPHRDAWETGERAARMLLDIVAGRLRPAMVMAKVPVLVGGVLGHTDGPGPFADVMRLAKQWEREPEIYSTSAYLVHPYLDLPAMGGGGLVITNGDWELAADRATQLGQLYWSKRHELEPVVRKPAEAIHAANLVPPGPIVLVEMADCCGGGAAGDSVATLKALLDASVREASLVPVVDPAAAAACHAAGEGASLTLDIGHHVDRRWGSSVRVTGRVARLSDGGFTYRGGIWGGRRGEMGPSARLEVGPIQIALTTYATYEWCGEQFESLGMDARQARFIVAKNPMNYHMAFEPFSNATFLLDTPGPTPPTLRGVTHQRLARPYYPADDEIPGLTPTLLRNPSRTIGDNRR